MIFDNWNLNLFQGLKLDETDDEKKKKEEIKVQFEGLCKLMKVWHSLSESTALYEDGATGGDDKTNMPALEEDVDKSNQMEEVD